MVTARPAPSRWWLTVLVISFELACADPATGTTDTWIRTFGTDQDDEARDVIAAVNGGSLIVGAREISPTVDRGNHQLVKLDPSGEVVWTSALDNRSSPEIGTTLVELDDGQIVTLGTTLLAEGTGSRVATWSPAGELVDTARYTSGPARIAHAIGNATSTTFTGWGTTGSLGDLLIGRLDADLEPEWLRVYNIGQGEAIAEFSNGDLVVCSVYDVEQTLLARIAAETGMVVWAIATAEGGFMACGGVVVDGDDQVLAGGYRTIATEGGRDLLLVSFTPDGDWQWTRTWGTPADEVIEDLVLDDAGVAAAGWTEARGNRDGLLARFARDGDLEWANTIGGADADELRAVDVDRDGFVVAVGVADRASRDQLWVRAAATGDVADGCDSIAPLAMSSTDVTNTFSVTPLGGTDVVAGEDRTRLSSSSAGSAQDECRASMTPDSGGDQETLYSCAIGAPDRGSALILALVALLYRVTGTGRRRRRRRFLSSTAGPDQTSK